MQQQPRERRQRLPGSIVIQTSKEISKLYQIYQYILIFYQNLHPNGSLYNLTIRNMCDEETKLYEW
eukprot:snap_masked-scaffold_60-processed-gene-0.37-mRNA-1 protein AED:1.00 eAED:1.00 QI:0/-1/0/0/-1/1/1/0/65